MMQTEQRDTFELPEALRLLEATPATLRALLEGLPEGWLRFQEDPEAWSPRTREGSLISSMPSSKMLKN